MDSKVPDTSFHKEERLCGKTTISRLLAEGKHGNVPGLRFLYRDGNGLSHPRLMISVPKKTFKRAVKRNLYKRRIRESWRKQKHLLNPPSETDILIMYSAKEMLTYEQIFTATGQIIEKLNRNTSKNTEHEGTSE